MIFQNLLFLNYFIYQPKYYQNLNLYEQFFFESNIKWLILVAYKIYLITIYLYFQGIELDHHLIYTP
jgi:hypothetical protein